MGLHAAIVTVLYLKVSGLKREWWIDLPELTSIQLGRNALWFRDNAVYSELIMRSGDDEMNWGIDLPKLTSLTTEEDSRSFEFPRSVILEGTSFHSSSSTDIPSLTTVTLEYYYVFANKKTVHTNSSSSSSPSFLDITPALQHYLSFPLSFTHNSSSIPKRTQTQYFQQTSLWNKNSDIKHHKTPNSKEKSDKQQTNTTVSQLPTSLLPSTSEEWTSKSE